MEQSQRTSSTDDTAWNLNESGSLFGRRYITILRVDLQLRNIAKQNKSSADNGQVVRGTCLEQIFCVNTVKEVWRICAKAKTKKNTVNTQRSAERLDINCIHCC